MSDRPNRAYRILLACLDVLTAAAFAALVAFVWTRSTLFLIGAGVQIALSLTSAAGLVVDRRLGRLLVRVAAWYQLGLLLALVVGIVFGAAYLWGLYGRVGTGAAVVFLVIGALLFELLGLLPVYKLRCVGLREQPRPAGRRWLLLCLGCVPVLVLALALTTRTAFAYPAWRPLDDAQRDRITHEIVDATRGRAPAPAGPGARSGSGDLYLLRLVSGGRTVHRAQARGGPDDIGARLAATIPLGLRPAPKPVAVVLDRVVAAGPILTPTALFALSIVPGLDGLAGTVGGREVVLLPQELIEQRMLTREQPIPFVPDFRAGVRRTEAETKLCRLAGANADCDVEGLDRVRTETWFACPGAEPLALVRGLPPGPALDREAALAAARAAGDYILAALGSDDRFVYLRDPATGTQRGHTYTLPRHAGPTWFLARLWRATGDARYLDGARRASSYLASRLVSEPGGRIALPRGHRVDLGVQALSLIAFAELAASGAAGPEDLARIRGMARMLRAFEKPDGDFWFDWDLRTDAPVPGPRRFYAAGQAALALTKAARLLGDAETSDAARRAMDFLAGPYWDFFLGDFFFLEEHWTCLAAREAWELFHDPDHARLCIDIGRFTLRLQHGPGAAFPDYVGGVGFSALFPPHTTPTASRAEALVAATELAAALGEPAGDLRRGVHDALRFLMHNQIRPVEACLLARPERTVGGVGWNYLDPDIRIDTVQHAGAVMLVGADLL